MFDSIPVFLTPVRFQQHDPPTGLATVQRLPSTIIFEAATVLHQAERLQPSVGDGEQVVPLEFGQKVEHPVLTIPVDDSLRWQGLGRGFQLVHLSCLDGADRDELLQLLGGPWMLDCLRIVPPVRWFDDVMNCWIVLLVNEQSPVAVESFIGVDGDTELDKVEFVEVHNTGSLGAHKAGCGGAVGAEYIEALDTGVSGALDA